MEDGKNPPRRSYTLSQVGIAASGVAGVAAVAAMWLSLPFVFLQPDEQLVMKGLFDVTVQNGPGAVVFSPFTTRGTKRNGIKLDERSYMVVRNELTAEERVVAGPQLYFLAAHELAGEQQEKLVLEKHQFARFKDARSGQLRLLKGPNTVIPTPFETLVQSMGKKGGPSTATKLSEMEYVVVTDQLTGALRIERGPQLLFPGVYESCSEVRRAYELKQHQYIKLLDKATGAMRVERGEQIVFPKATEEPTEADDGEEGPSTATKLSEMEYVVVTDQLTGALRIERGPQLLFPGVYESCSGVRRAYELKQHQYIKLLDKATGAMRVERGEQIVFPKATEEPTEADDGEAVRDAVGVDDETAVLVRSLKTGQQRLVTEGDLFVPAQHEEIVEVRKLVRVEPHEVAIVRDNKGAYHFHAGNQSGDGQGTAFFLPPHCDLVTMHWSSGTSKEDLARNVVKNAKSVAYKVPVQKIDLRAQYAFFEYSVRTADNVELVLEGTIFWQVLDVPTMIERTGDPKGDVWYHARSALIQAVSSVTLEQFMASFNSIVSRAAATDAAFYAQRGVQLHGLEVTRYECRDARTAGVLQEIIQETTNRINRMQKQRSENEVEREKLQSQIGLEQQRTQLIEARTANEKLEASVQGEADGTRLAQNTRAFLTLLNASVPDGATRLELLRFFTEQATLTKQTEHLATGNATLFLTPQDVNLKLLTGGSGVAKTLP